jgi:2-polyprenyl-6-methoxyphenol hydroxylase-like FAD-dependent oxidoreductase
LVELGDCVEPGVEFEGFSRDDNGVTAIIDGNPVRARYLVGADGGRSSVRKAAGVGFAGETLEQHRMLIADVRIAGLDRDHWHIWEFRRDAGVHAPPAGRRAGGSTPACRTPTTSAGSWRSAMAVRRLA